MLRGENDFLFAYFVKDRSISEKFLALDPHEELPIGDFDYSRGVSSREMDHLRIFRNRIFLKYVPKDLNVTFL